MVVRIDAGHAMDNLWGVYGRLLPFSEPFGAVFLALELITCKTHFTSCIVYRMGA